MAFMQKVRHYQVAFRLQALKLDCWSGPQVCRESYWHQWDTPYTLGGWPHGSVREGMGFTQLHSDFLL